MSWSLCVRMSGVLGLLLFLLTGAAAGQDQKQSEQAKKNEDFYKSQSALGRRTNGVRLQVKATVQAGDKGDQIRLDWTLDYDGPRPPLTILEPTLEGYTSGQTVGVFYAEGKDRRPYEYEVPSPPKAGGFGYHSPKNFFITVEKAKQASGTTMLPVAKLRGYYTKHWPDQFGDAPPAVRVQLWHKPIDRGVGFDLDAWTGEVLSPVVHVPLNKW